jgi:Flp pilus assembly protein TadG
VSVLRRLRGEQGEVGLVSALLLLAGVLLPLMFLVVAFARVEQGRLAAAQAARDAVRAAVEAPSPAQAEQAAADALRRAQDQTGVALQLRLGGQFARGAVLRADTSAQVELASLPFLGQFGSITVGGSAQAPVDSYRSLLSGASP